MVAKPFPCPDCGGPTTVRAGYPRHHDTVRYRLCRECGEKFKTVHIYGQPEAFEEWAEPAKDEGPPAEIEPLELEALDPAAERRLRLRALFICCKSLAVNGRRPAWARSGGNGYALDPEGAFYRER